MPVRSKFNEPPVKISKKRHSSRSLQKMLTAAVAVASGVSTQFSRAAMPIAVTQIERGSASIANSGSLTTITAANRTIIDYSEFDIPVGDTVRFIQPNASSVVLNRISGASPSQIDGNLFANGIIYLVNPAGVMFGNNSVVNVSQIFAAAGNMSNQDFLSGVNHFSDINGSVTNTGNITASAVNFIGNVVSNAGEILAPGGTVVMASGHDVILGQLDGNVYVQIDNTGATASSSSTAAAVSNTGTISAKGGKVTMAAGDLMSLSIENNGAIEADDVSIQGGANSSVLVSGSINVSNSNGAGGTVTINGGNIGIGVVHNADGSYADAPVAINADGSSGGGKILVGVKPDASSKTGYADASNYDYISSKATLTADATVKGNGGLVDTSGATLTVAPGATISTQGAGGGSAGEWLLDPVNIDIVNTPTSANINGGAGGYALGGTVYFAPDAAAPTPATVYAGDIVTALDNGDNVTIQTVPVTGPDIGSDAGNIVLGDAQNPLTDIVSIDPNIPAGDSVVLTLAATTNIDIIGNIQPVADSAGILNVVLSAGGSIYIGGVFSGGKLNPGPGYVSTFSTTFGGSVNFEVGGDIYINSTNPDINSADVPLGGAINTSGILGGGSVLILSTSLVNIQPGSTPLTTGGIFTGGGGLLLISPNFNIGAITLSTAGYGPGAGGGAMMIFSSGLGNLGLDGVVIDTQGALGTGNYANSAAGGGAVAILSDAGLQNEGSITINDVTFETGGSGGGTVDIFPGGGSYYYGVDNNPYDITAGYLNIEGTNVITSAPLAGVTNANVGKGGGITINAVYGDDYNDAWMVSGGQGGYTAAGTPASQGGGITYSTKSGFNWYSSNGGPAPSGVPALTAAPIVFTALQTSFINGGTPQNPVAPSVTSDGGGQIYMNSFKIPAIPMTDYDDQFVVGNITPVNNTLVQDVGTGAVTAADSSYGVIDFDGLVNDAPGGSVSLTVATASGDVAFDFPIGMPLSYTEGTGTAATTIPLGDPLSSLTIWAGYDLTASQLNNSAKWWVALEGVNTMGQIQVGATTMGLESVGTLYMNNLKQMFSNGTSYDASNGNGYSTAGNKDNPFYLDTDTIMPAPLEFGSGAYQDVIDNTALIETSGSMFLQGVLVEENIKDFGKVNGIEYDYVGSTTLVSSDGDIDLDLFSYFPFINGYNGSGARIWASPLTLISYATGTMTEEGNYLGSATYATLTANGDGNYTSASSSVDTTMSTFAINVDGNIPIYVNSNGSRTLANVIYWGTNGPATGVGSLGPSGIVPAGSIILPSSDRSVSVFSVVPVSAGNYYSNLSAGITATPGLIVPVASIAAYGGNVLPLSNYPYGVNPMPPPADFTQGFFENDGFMAVAADGGNIFVGGPSPAPSNGGPLNDGWLGVGGSTIDAGEVLILATNQSTTAESGYSGNIEIGPGAFLEGIGGIASVSPFGNSGNITFDNGARAEAELIVTLSTASSSSYSSGNIIFQPSTTGVESNITSGEAYIGSVSFAGNSGNITLGYDVNITSSLIQIESVTGDTNNYIPFVFPPETDYGSAFQTTILDLVEEVSIDPMTGLPTISPLSLFGVPLTYLNVGNQTLSTGAPYNELVAPPSPMITGAPNSGNIFIGAGDQINGSSVAIGSYSSIGNSGNNVVGVGTTPTIITGPTSKISSSGYLVIFSEAGYKADAFGAGNPAVAGASGSILIQGGVVNTNIIPNQPTSATESMQLITTGVQSGTYAVTYGNITISSASYTVPTDPAITVAGAGYLSTADPLGSAGYIDVTANVLTINEAAAYQSSGYAAYAGLVSSVAVNSSGKEAGYINLFGFTGVNIVSGTITAQGGLPYVAKGISGGGGAIVISSSGYVQIGPALSAAEQLQTAANVTINSSSAYNGGGGGVAIFSTSASGAYVTLNNVTINSSGAGIYDATDSLSDIDGGGGGAVAIINTGDIFINNVTIDTQGNGSGAVVINSASGYIAFTDTNGGVNEVQTGVGQFPSGSYGGGGGVFLEGSLSSGGSLYVGGGGGSKSGYAGGGSYFGPIALLIGIPSGVIATSGYGAGVFTGGGFGLGGGYGLGGGSGDISSSGNYYYAGSAPGSSTYLALYGSSIQFGAPINANAWSSGNYNPVSLITTGSGQYFGYISSTTYGYNNNTIILYATATIQAGLPTSSPEYVTTPIGSEWDITFGPDSTINQAASLLPIPFADAPGNGGLNVVNYNGNINFEGDIGNTGELSSLSASIIPFPSASNWQIRLYTNGTSNSSSGYFSSTTYGNQSFNGNVVLEDNGDTNPFFDLLTTEGGSIQITGTLKDSAGYAFNVSLKSSATYGHQAILIGGSAYTNGGYFRAIASSGYNMLPGASGAGNISIGAANYDGSVNNALNPVISTDGGNVLIESVSSTGASGTFTPLGALTIESGGGYVTIESISSDGASGDVNVSSNISIDSGGNNITLLSQSNTAAGGISLGGLITSDGGNILVESDSSTGSSGTINGSGANFSIQSGGGYVTIESLAGGGNSGNINLSSTYTSASMLDSGGNNIIILAQSSYSGSYSGSITLGGAITSEGGNVLVESNSTAGASGNITGQSTGSGAFSIASGGGYVTLESFAGYGNSGNISLSSTASPMIDSDGGPITVLTQATSAGYSSGNITLGGGITSEGGNVLVESSSTLGPSGNIIGENDPFSINSGGGYVTIESLAGGGSSGYISLISTANPMISSGSGAITILTQTTAGGYGSGNITLGGVIVSTGGNVLVESDSTAGYSGSITGQDPFSITSGGGYITIESLAGGEESGNISLSSTASPMLNSGGNTITILSQTTSAGYGSGDITLGGAITSGGGYVLVESDSTAGYSGSITGQDPFSITSGGGAITIESLAGGESSGNISLTSTANPMISSGNGAITILTQTTASGYGSGNITLGGVIVSTGGNVLVESNSTAGYSGSITGQDPFSISAGSGTITIESLAAGGDSGYISLSSTAIPMLSTTDNTITILTQTTAAGYGSGNIALGGVITSSGGNVLVESNSTAGYSGSITGLDTFSIQSAGGNVTIETLAAGSSYSSGNITLGGLITSEFGNVLVKTESTGGASGNIIGQDTFSIQSTGGYITLESLSTGGDSGYISLVSTATPMLSTDDANITVLTQTTSAGYSSGDITLDGAITSTGGNILVKSDSTLGASGNITGSGNYFSIASGGGYVKIESLASSGSSGYISLVSTPDPMISSGSGAITILTQTTSAGYTSGNITLGGVITSTSGNVLVESNSTAGYSGNITGESPLAINTGSGTITIESLSTGGDSGYISLSSTATPMLSTDDANITVLTQTTSAGYSSGDITLDGAITSAGGNILVESASSGLNAGNITIEQTVSSAAYDGGDITIESLAGTGAPGTITITAGVNSGGYGIFGGTGGNILVRTGSAGIPLGNPGNITISGAGYLNSSASFAGNVTVTSQLGLVTINSTAGYAVNASGNYAGGAINIYGGNGVTISDAPNTGSITSGAYFGGGGGIAISSVNGPINIGQVTITSAGYVGDGNGDASGGGIAISAIGSGTITLNGTFINSSATGGFGGGAVILAANTGDISLDDVTVDTGSAATSGAGAFAVITSGNIMLSGSNNFDTHGPAGGDVGGGGGVNGTAVAGTDAGGGGGYGFASGGVAGGIATSGSFTYVSGPVRGGGGLATGGYEGSGGAYLGGSSATPGPAYFYTSGVISLASTGTINGLTALEVYGQSGVNFSGTVGQTVAPYSVTISSGSGYVTVGAITATGNISLTPSTNLYLGGLGAGDYRPQGLLTINGNLASTGGNVILGDALSEVPSVATIVGNFNTDPGPGTLASNLTISAAGDVIMGQNQKFTQFGNLTITAGAEAKIGDINTVGNTGNLTVTAPSIVINLRPAGQLVTSLGGLNGDLTPPPSIVDGTDFVASGKITFVGTVTTAGAGAQPLFASSTASGNTIVVNGKGVTVLPYGLPSLAGNPLKSQILAILAENNIAVAFQGSPIPNGLALYNNTPLDLNAQDLPPEVIALYEQLIATDVLLSETNISTIILPPPAPPGYPAITPPLPGTGGQLALQGAGLDLTSPTIDEILTLVTGSNPLYGPVPPFGSGPENITTLSLGNSSLNQLLADYNTLFCFQGGAPNWFQQPSYYEIIGQRRNIQKILSQAYNIYLNSTQFDMSEQGGFVEFLQTHRNSDPTLAQALEYIQQIGAICDDMYQAGVTPGQFQNVEDAFLGPLKPVSMPMDQFVSIVAPQQLQLSLLQ